MKFLVDANLPFRLAKLLKSKGFDVIHTTSLPDAERTDDIELRRISTNQNRIMITKDSDFLDSHIIQGIPEKLLLITTGNIVNNKLIALFDQSFETIVQLFETHNLIELSEQEIVVHEK